MPSDLCIFEDNEVENLYPLSLTRPAFDLRSGIFSLKEKIVRFFPGSRVHYFVRDMLVDILHEKHENALINSLPQKDAYFINSRFLSNSPFPAGLEKSTVFMADGKIAGAFVRSKDLKDDLIADNAGLNEQRCKKFAKMDLQGQWIKYLWDLVNTCAEQITSDFSFIQYGAKLLGNISPNVSVLNEKDVYIAPGAVVHPGVVLNAEDGPIYISKGALIMSNSIIQGPVFIGSSSVVKAGTRIYGGTSIGGLCKVGGEIETAIIQANSNKPHEGFLGHAYLGEWVNLGADTNNSNLKNNYSTIKVHVNGRDVDSQSIFAGLFMGDHAKSGINTMFNTGVTVGVMANVFGAGFSPKHIPSFTWGGINSTEKYNFDKAIETAKIAMKRRGKEITAAEVTLLKKIYDQAQFE
ncbi:MAG: hypothetical protein DWQ05_03695 [Calditrichaeota bacterium]|nr:MAG: hypothetical protein DWQ05_03695 [Calditrichota bacterium]